MGILQQQKCLWYIYTQMKRITKELFFLNVKGQAGFELPTC